MEAEVKAMSFNPNTKTSVKVVKQPNWSGSHVKPMN